MLCCAVTLQFSQGVITVSTATSIPKPELFDRKLCLVSQQTAVFTPYIVILITVTTKSGDCAWVGHPACALTIDRCSTPVRHLSRITWHPPSVWTTIITEKQNRVITLILNKLYTMWRYSGKTRQLRHTRSCVMNVTWVTTSTAISIHMCSAFTVVTYNCHANSTLISHVTENCEWCLSSFAIWINNVISANNADVLWTAEKKTLPLELYWCPVPEDFLPCTCISHRRFLQRYRLSGLHCQLHLYL